ncbi:MAG: polysaccharide biosynthesis protein [Clostridia bacterium]|nr:polysaccharide biosynthesis protein [Clostridia bacterium]
MECKKFFKDKNILIVGGTGSIGQALVKQIVNYEPKVIRVFSRDEYKQFVMQDEFRGLDNIRFLLGDVRDKDRLERAMHKIDMVFDLAALKHVPACEYNPFEAVKTNVMGTQNIIECAIENRVERVIYTSSDKAVSPTNTMGATKLLAERLISAADYAKGGKTPIFASVRFGNVIGSRGSVIPLWQSQIRQGKDITVTDQEMTRFMMSIKEAVQLVLEACKLARGGEVFVLKMPIIKLGDLAKVIIEDECAKSGVPAESIKVTNIGLRPGEKMYEELMTAQESLNAIEYDDMFAILPHHKMSEINNYGVKLAEFGEYSSHGQTSVSEDEIKAILKESMLI